MATPSISERDVEALARTAMSEVGHFARYGDATLKGGVEAVVDTIINRSVHPSYPHTIEGVVNQRFQFSAIGGPGGTGTWTGLKRASSAVFNIVERHLEERASGGACTVQGAQHFLNPYQSSSSALREWGDYVWKNPVAVWGRARDIHYHGFAPRAHPPPPYTIIFRGVSGSFSGRGVAQPPIAPEMIAPEAAMVQGEREPPRMVRRVFAPTEGDILAKAPAYRVEHLAPVDLVELQDSLNCFVERGWRLRHLIPDKTEFIAVLESIGPVRPAIEAENQGPITGWTDRPGVSSDVMPMRAAVEAMAPTPTDTADLLPNPRNADMHVNPSLHSVIKDGVRRFQLANRQYAVEVAGPASGMRKSGGHTSNHGPQKDGYGGALDILIKEINGAYLSNYQDGETAPIYQLLANYVKLAQEQLFPALKIRFGGYFSGKKGTYGALDLMHFDVLAGKGMRGGSWEDGFTREQMKYWGIKRNVGMRQFRKIQLLAGQEPSRNVSA